MQRLSILSYVVMCGAAVVLWGAIASVCLLVGSTGFGLVSSEVMRLRWIDSVAPASIIGAALATAGMIYQSVLRNALADPYLLGVASGATLGKVLWLLPAAALTGAFPIVSALGQQATAFLGASGAMLVVFAVASRRGRLEPATLLLTGVIVSSLIAALLMLVIEFSRARAGVMLDVQTVLMAGVPGNLTSMQLKMAMCLTGAGMAIALGLAPQLAVASLSDVEAASLGLRLQRLRWVGLGVASLITASAVALSGPIGFVGLVCPHLARLVSGPDPRRSLFVAAALGASLLALADGISRLMAMEQLLGTRLPAGVLTALLGGPFFLALLLKQRRDAERA